MAGDGEKMANNFAKDTENSIQETVDGDQQETIVSLGEVLQETEYWENTATAVLGGSDQQECSYDQGYVKRQALYACLTCNPPDSSTYADAGICLACSIKCHRDHDLVELYTKRNFRCDCGNKKFASGASHCQLQPIKSDFNSENKYDHNFRGLYCICDRPYPDEEDDEEDGANEDEMIQCVVCEDWLHGRHTENDDVDVDDDLIEEGDFVCKACTGKCDFLSHYAEFLLKRTSAEPNNLPSSLIPTAAVTEERNSDDVLGKSDSSSQNTNVIDNDGGGTTHNGLSAAEDMNCGESTVLNGISDSSSQNSDSVQTSDVKEVENTERVESHDSVDPVSASCCLDSTTSDTSIFSGGTWWSKNWRLRLCKCDKCLVKYEALGVKFLVDPEDPLEVYEARGREKAKENLANGADGQLEALFNEMDRVKQIEVVHAVNEMKEGILEMVGRANADGRPVSREDVQVLFEALRNKRRRLDVYIPDTCR